MIELRAQHLHQMFSDYEKSLSILGKYVDRVIKSELESAGIIHFFEVSFDLAAKMIRDYLETQGYQAESPREVFKKALDTGIIENGHVWMDALADRQLTSQNYEIKFVEKLVKDISALYFPELKKLHEKLNGEV